MDVPRKLLVAWELGPLLIETGVLQAAGFAPKLFGRGKWRLLKFAGLLAAALGRRAQIDPETRSLLESIEERRAKEWVLRKVHLRLLDWNISGSLLAAEWSLNGYEHVILWNGFQRKLMYLTAIVQYRKLNAVYLENGFFPRTLQIDRQGVNAASSLAHLSPDDIDGFEVNAALEKRLAEVEFPTRKVRSKGGEPSPDIADVDERALPVPYVLFVCQVAGDTQLYRFSPDFDAVSALEHVIAGVGDYRDRFGPLNLVVKQHPTEPDKTLYAGIGAGLPWVQFLDNVENEKLIDNAEVVVTVNSSMGFQAIHAGKPLIALGEAAFNHAGACIRVAGKDDFAASLERARGTAAFSQKTRVGLLATALDRYTLPRMGKGYDSNAAATVAREIVARLGSY